jgi:hypothetical protein
MLARDSLLSRCANQLPVTPSVRSATSLNTALVFGSGCSPTRTSTVPTPMILRALGAISHYQGTARVTAIVDGNRAFLEWSVNIECPAEEQKNCTTLLQKAIPQWMNSLRATLERRTEGEGV